MSSTNIRLNNIQNELNYIEYVINTQGAGNIGPQGPQGPIGPASTVPGPVGPVGGNGASSYTLSLVSGVTFNNSPSSLSFPLLGAPSAVAYAVTDQSWNNCSISATTATNQNISFIGLRTNKTPTNLSTPYLSCDWYLQANTNGVLYLYNAAALIANIPLTGSINTFSVVYNNGSLTFYQNNAIISAFTQTLASNLIFYGYLSSYNQASSNILNNICFNYVASGSASTVPGPAGENGVSLFDITLNGGATYTAGSLSSFSTNSSTGYAVTTQAYNSGCLISSYNTRANATYIGLTETTTVTNPSTPFLSFSHVLYSDSTKLYRMDSGVLSTKFDVYPNSNPNYVFSVKYDNNNLYFYLDGQEAVNLRLNVGAGKIYYGCWSSYQNKTFSNIQFVPLAEGIQGVKGDTGIQGIQGVKGDTGNIQTPVNNLVEFNAGIGMAGGANNLSINDSGESMTLSLNNHVGSIHTNNQSANTDASLLFNGNNVSTSFLNQLTNVRTTPLSVDSTSVTITDTLNVSNQINCRSVVAEYEFAVYPTGTDTTSNFILGSNNNNNYNLFQYNPVSGTTNELLLQYQENSIQPSTTKTLMTVLPSGDIQLGYLQSASPNVQIAGTAGLGRVYDTIYNKPSSGGIGYTTFNLASGMVITPLTINTICQFSTLGIFPDAYDITIDFTSLNIVGVNTGFNTNPFTLLIYLGIGNQEAYSNTTGINLSLVSPGVSTGAPFNYSTTSPITLKYYSKTTYVSTISLFATLISTVSGCEVSINNLNFTALIKVGNDGISKQISTQ